MGYCTGVVNPPSWEQCAGGAELSVCTIEKGHDILVKLLQEDMIGDVGILVIDEVRASIVT